MTKFAGILAGLLLLSTTAAHAGVLTLGATAKSLGGVNIAQSAQVSVAGQPVTLNALGAGIRTTKLGFFNINVYVGEIFTDSATPFQKAPDLSAASLQKAQASADALLESSQNIAVTMNFVTAIVTSDQLVSAFTSGFTDNAVDTTSPAISKLLAAIRASGNIVDNNVLTFTIHKNADSSVVVTYQDENGAVTQMDGDNSLLMNVMNLWIGKSSDSGVTALTNSILQGM